MELPEELQKKIFRFKIIQEEQDRIEHYSKFIFVIDELERHIKFHYVTLKPRMVAFKKMYDSFHSSFEDIDTIHPLNIKQTKEFAEWVDEYLDKPRAFDLYLEDPWKVHALGFDKEKYSILGHGELFEESTCSIPDCSEPFHPLSKHCKFLSLVEDTCSVGILFSLQLILKFPRIWKHWAFIWEKDTFMGWSNPFPDLPHQIFPNISFDDGDIDFMNFKFF